MDLQFGEWKSHNCFFEIVPDNIPTVLGRDRLKELGLRKKIIELPKKLSKYACNNVTPVFSAEQQAVALKFPDIVTRNGQSKSHVARSTFKDNYTVRHQKGRRIPVYMQDEVSAELKRW